MSRRAPRSTAGLAAVVVAMVVVTLVGGGGPASAQEPVTRPVPILTVTDPAVERCGGIALQGRDFAPERQMDISVNGVAADEPPFSDATGAFTFTTEVACEQASGFVQIRASDGEAAVPIEIAVGEARDPVGRPATAGAPVSDPSAEIARWAGRAILLGILAAELVALHRLRGHRRRSASSSASA